MCDQTNFTIVTPLRSRDAQTVAEALIYIFIYLFGPPRQIICDEAAEFTSHIVQAILHMLHYKLKVISPYNHGSNKVERQIKTVSDIIVKHLWDKGQIWPLFVTTAAYAMNTFASEALYIYICLFTYTIGYKLHYFVHELIDVYERSHRSRSCCSLNPMGLSILYCVINS